jgi:hypothetical protein
MIASPLGDWTEGVVRGRTAALCLEVLQDLFIL